MSDKVVTISNTFDFSPIQLAHPIGLQGGSYFTKLTLGDSPLYVQTPKCTSKQGIVRTTNKSYIDLMYSSSQTDVIQWFEDLEKRMVDLIYERRNAWFHTSIEREDIESQFNSPIRIYRSGKYYIVRAYLTSGSDTMRPMDLHCYDEDSNPVDPNMMDNTSLDIIPLVEIQGVKFSSKSFHCEIKLKQVLVLKSEEDKLEDTCLIKRVITNREKIPDPPSSEHLEELDLSYEEVNTQTIQLRKPVDVYKDMWKNARAQAKLARKQAIEAYMIAKNIKTTHVLSDVYDSEDEFDRLLEQKE